MSNELDTLIEIQKELLKATEAKTIAEIEALEKSRELIAKREESIKLSKEAMSYSKQIIDSLNKLVEQISTLIDKSQYIKLAIEKIDILILLTQIMIQIVGKIEGVDREHIIDLEKQLKRLIDISAAKESIVIQTVGSITSDQANIGKDVKGQKDG